MQWVNEGERANEMPKQHRGARRPLRNLLDPQGPTRMPYRHNHPSPSKRRPHTHEHTHTNTHPRGREEREGERTTTQRDPATTTSARPPSAVRPKGATTLRDCSS